MTAGKKSTKSVEDELNDEKAVMMVNSQGVDKYKMNRSLNFD